MDEKSKKLIEAVKNDLTPSLGVTEPGAIAYAAAAAARALGGRVEQVSVKLNSGIYKNSFTCAVPGTGGMGCALAAALGAVSGDPERKLMSTEGASAEDTELAKRLVFEGRAKAELASLSPDIHIEAEVITDLGRASAVIEGRHDRLVKLTVNGNERRVPSASDHEKEASVKVSSFSFADILNCVRSARDLEFLDDAVKTDMTLFGTGELNGLMPLTEARCDMASCYGDAVRFAERLTCGAIEARVRGAAAPAMAITGSGSHGILCMLPIHAAAVKEGFCADAEQRALLLSSLVTMYIKELSGLLSTACGCVLAGGTGAALGLTYLYSVSRDPSVSDAALGRMLKNALDSMAASVTGMICHGGNTGCSLKAAVGVNMAFSACKMALGGTGAEPIHGILGDTAEATMRNMGRIAANMVPLEGTIIDIMSCKSGQNLL